MGAAARRKRARVQLTEAQFYKLKAVSAQTALLQHQHEQERAAAQQQLDDATRAAGLTVGIKYKMDETTFTAIEIES